jgi:hypothetical protein
VLQSYQNEEAVRSQELPLSPSHLSYLDIAYDSNKRALALLYTNGNGLIFIKFPSQTQETVDLPPKRPVYLNNIKGKSDSSERAAI